MNQPIRRFGSVLLVPVAALAIAACGGGSDPEPFAFESPEGDFAITFPDGEPEEQTQQAPTPAGPVDVVFHIDEVDGRAYAVARTDYSSIATPDQFDVAAGLQGAQDQAIAGNGGTLVESTDIELEGIPGRQFIAAVESNGESGTVVARVYIDPETLVSYQALVTGEGEFGASDEDVAAFFDSLELTG